MPYLLGEHSPFISPNSWSFLGHLGISQEEPQNLRDTKLWLRNWTPNPVQFKNIVQGHRFSSHCLVLKLLGMLLWICFEKELKKILLRTKRHSYYVCNKCSQWGAGNYHGNMIKSLRTSVKKMNGTRTPLCINGYNSKIISSLITVISYIPLFLGFLVNQRNQDFQVRPKYMGGKKSELVTLICTISLRLEMQLKNVRRLPLFPVILLAQVLPVNKIITIYIMLRFRWSWASLILEFISISTD